MFSILYSFLVVTNKVSLAVLDFSEHMHKREKGRYFHQKAIPIVYGYIFISEICPKNGQLRLSLILQLKTC
jgi:hypothetical protein